MWTTAHVTQAVPIKPNTFVAAWSFFCTTTASANFRNRVPECCLLKQQLSFRLCELAEPVIAVTSWTKGRKDPPVFSSSHLSVASIWFHRLRTLSCVFKWRFQSSFIQHWTSKLLQIPKLQSFFSPHLRRVKSLSRTRQTKNKTGHRISSGGSQLQRSATSAAPTLTRQMERLKPLESAHISIQ